MKIIPRIAWAVSLIIGLSVVRVSAAQEKVQAQLVADTAAVQAGKPFTVGIHLNIADGWHVYWSNPGDAGLATKVTLTLPPGFTAGPVEYPVPEKLPQPGGLIVYAYEKELLLKATVTPPADLTGVQNVAIAANVNWCVCADVCVLGKKTVEISLPVTIDLPQTANDPLFLAWSPRFPVSADNAFSAISATAVGGSGTGGQVNALVELTWRDRSPGPAEEFQWLPAACDDLTVKATKITATGDVTTVQLKIDPVQGISPASSTIDGLLAYYTPGRPAIGAAVTFKRAALGLPASP